MKQDSIVAVVGTGSIGMRHLDVLRRISGVRPVAVPCRPQRMTDLEKAGHEVVRDLQEAVSLGATRCIIASDTGRHLEHGLQAVDHGLDVLVEKPLCADAWQARQLVSKGQRAQKKVFVACMLRFSESLNEFREWLVKLGRLHAVRIECQSYLPQWRPKRSYRDSYSARADEGGVLRDVIHEIDYAGWLYGWPDAVQARLANLGRLGIQSEETADLLWTTASGCQVSVRLDYLTAPHRRSMTACGEGGVLEWDGIGNTTRYAPDGSAPTQTHSSQTRDDMLEAQDRAFFGATGGWTDPRLATGLDGMRALAVCDAARRASESRREEMVQCP
jgi:predicted dehydrogenase